MKSSIRPLPRSADYCGEYETAAVWNGGCGNVQVFSTEHTNSLIRLGTSQTNDEWTQTLASRNISSGLS